MDVSPDALRGRVLVKGKLPKPKAIKGRGSVRYSAGEFDTGESFDSKSRRDLRTRSLFGPFSPFARRLTGKASRFDAPESRGSLVSVSSLGSPRDTADLESATVESETTLPSRRRSLPFNLALPSFGGASAGPRVASSPKGGRLGLREVRAAAAATTAAITTTTTTAKATITATGAQKIAGAPRLGRGGARDGLGRDAH